MLGKVELVEASFPETSCSLPAPNDSQTMFPATFLKSLCFFLKKATFTLFHSEQTTDFPLTTISHLCALHPDNVSLFLSIFGHPGSTFSESFLSQSRVKQPHTSTKIAQDFHHTGLTGMGREPFQLRTFPPRDKNP